MEAVEKGVKCFQNLPGKYKKKVWNMIKITHKNVIDVVSVFYFVNFEHISHLFLMFLLLTLNKQMLAGKHS